MGPDLSLEFHSIPIYTTLCSDKIKTLMSFMQFFISTMYVPHKHTFIALLRHDELS